MRRITAVIAVVCLVVAFAFAPEVWCREGGNLYNFLNEKGQVKTYVSDITDSSGHAKADLVALKGVLEDALATRMTIDFELVSKRQDADIIIDCDITEFLWTDEDPVDNITGIGPIILDSITTENYGRIQAVFRVTDAVRNRQLWQKRIKATITSKEITEEASVSMLNERIVKIFMRDCLSKTRSGR